MANQQLKEYVDQQVSKGATKEQINDFLLKSGWKQSDIDAEMNNKDSGMNLPPPPPPPADDKVVKNTLKTKSNPNMWDTFAHVILFISLYVMATAGGLLLHYLIDMVFPADASKLYSNLRQTTINWYLASFIVATPIFCVAFLDIAKRTTKNPQIRNIQIRKVFIYITLVITFLFMLFHVTTSVYSVLSGNVSLNSFLHLIVNISIPASIFGYLAFQVRGDRELNE